MPRFTVVYHTSAMGQAVYKVGSYYRNDIVDLGRGKEQTTAHCTKHGYRSLPIEEPCCHMRAVLNHVGRTISK